MVNTWTQHSRSIQNHRATSLVSVIFVEIKKRQLISPRMPQGLDNDLSQASLTKKVHIHYTHIYTLTETTQTCTHNTFRITQVHNSTHVHTHISYTCAYTTLILHIYIHTHILHTYTYAQRPRYTQYICTHIHTPHAGNRHITHVYIQHIYAHILHSSHTCIHHTHIDI